jgi:hypothetical protein
VGGDERERERKGKETKRETATKAKQTEKSHEAKFRVFSHLLISPLVSLSFSSTLTRYPSASSSPFFFSFVNLSIPHASSSPSPSTLFSIFSC